MGACRTQRGSSIVSLPATAACFVVCTHLHRSPFVSIGDIADEGSRFCPFPPISLLEHFTFKGAKSYTGLPHARRPLSHSYWNNHFVQQTRTHMLALLVSLLLPFYFSPYHFPSPPPPSHQSTASHICYVLHCSFMLLMLLSPSSKGPTVYNPPLAPISCPTAAAACSPSPPPSLPPTPPPSATASTAASAAAACAAAVASHGFSARWVGMTL